MTRRRNWIAVFAVGAMLSGSFVQADESAVYFPTDSSQLSAKSKAALKKLTSSSGGLKLHASSEPRGSEDVNARLREERVRSVREFLVSIGVAESQIQSDGGAAGDGPPSSWARLRKVAIEAEGGAVAETGTSASDKKAAAVEQKRAAANAKRKAIADKQAVAAEQKRMTAEQKRMTAEQRTADNDYVDNDGAYKDLSVNKIDIAIGLPPNDVEFLRKHPGYVRVSYAKYFPYMPCCRQIVTRSQLKNSRDKYVRLLRASIRAHQYTIQHPRETSAILGKWLKTPPDVIREAIMSTYISLNPDPMRKGVELLQRTNENITGMKASVAEYIDTSLYRDALFGLAKENDDDGSKGYYDTMISRFRANN